MNTFENTRFRQLVQKRAESLGYCPMTVRQIVRVAVATGLGTLAAQAHQVVPYPASSATCGDAA
ncbi:hypothetical protein BCL79_0650 [Stenotrophomonas rhizophila]|uniref:Uncharacterized protein n=1 Tax=Stenotrophomonas rhizophila TaxID=216778 RepID=A0A498CEP0_9GAMM|nr:hypothetical protein [Stenotrophomonas rhizophila]RLK56266.1 hypothetical protein BCL79_0650 [Stenotrophomonas rhizophila]